MKHIVHVCLIVAFLLTGCSEKKSNTKIDETSKVLYVLNQGAFMMVDASLSVIDRDSLTIRNDLFYDMNGRQIGDILQSATLIDDKLYLVVNNSQKIEIIHPQTYLSMATVTTPDGSSPRYLVNGLNNSYYVTDLYSSNLYKYSTITNALEKTITVGSNPDGIAVIENYAYIALSGFGTGKKVIVLELFKDEIEKQITVNDNPVKVIEADDMIWVVSIGAYNDFADPNDDTPGAIQMIDPITKTVAKKYEFEGHPGDFTIDSKNKYIYITYNGLKRLDYSGQTISDPEHLKDESYYGLFYDEDTERLYAADAGNFSQKGRIDIFDKDMNIIKSLNTGVAPGGFLKAEFDIE